MLKSRRAFLQIAAAGPLVAQQKLVPAGTEMANPPEMLPPVNNPRFVSAGEAQIPGEAMVFGVDLDNQPRAYSLNLIAKRGVVNDSTGETDFSAVWAPLANAAAVYRRVDQDSTVDLHLSGRLYRASPVLTAQPTGSQWSMMTRLPVEDGREYLDQLAVGERLTWNEWRARFPQGMALSLDGAEHVETSGFEEYFESKDGFGGLEATDTRLKTKDPVYGFLSRGVYYAADHDAIVGGKRYKIPGIGEVLLFRGKHDEPLRGTAAFRSGSGFKKRAGYWTEEATGTVLLPELRDFTGSVVERLTGLDSYWYCWSLANPETELLK